MARCLSREGSTRIRARCHLPTFIPREDQLRLQMPQSQGAYLMKKSLTFLLLVCASLAVAGCGSSSGGPLIIVTPTPAPTATATAVPSATPTATATPPPTSILLNGSAFQGAIVTKETILAYSELLS